MLCQRTAPHAKELSGPNVSSAEVEKLLYKSSQFRTIDLFLSLLDECIFPNGTVKFQEAGTKSVVHHYIPKDSRVVAAQQSIIECCL